jgi:hypothetical protein
MGPPAKQPPATLSKALAANNQSCSRDRSVGDGVQHCKIDTYALSVQFFDNLLFHSRTVRRSSNLDFGYDGCPVNFF